MSALEIFMACVAYAIIGAVVVETARIWFGMWWLTISISTLIFWPLIALSALFGKHHES